MNWKKKKYRLLLISFFQDTTSTRPIDSGGYLFGVYDGHGGGKASDYCNRGMPFYILKKNGRKEEEEEEEEEEKENSSMDQPHIENVFRPGEA